MGFAQIAITKGAIKKMNKKVNKKEGEELQEYLAFKRRGSRVESKKGKGSFKRHPKHKGKTFNYV